MVLRPSEGQYKICLEYCTAIIYLNQQQREINCPNKWYFWNMGFFLLLQSLCDIETLKKKITLHIFFWAAQDR